MPPDYEEPSARARRLLTSLLTPTQRDQYRRLGTFWVTTKEGRFELGLLYDIGFYPKRSGREYRLCVVPSGDDDLPEADIWVNLLLALLHDPRGFLKVANWGTPLGRWHCGPFPLPPTPRERIADLIEQLEGPTDTTEDVIRRHFDQFKQLIGSMALYGRYTREELSLEVGISTSTLNEWAREEEQRIHAAQVEFDERRRRRAALDRYDQLRFRFHRDVAGFVLDDEHSVEYIAQRLLLAPEYVGEWVRQEQQRRLRGQRLQNRRAQLAAPEMTDTAVFPSGPDDIMRELDQLLLDEDGSCVEDVSQW